MRTRKGASDPYWYKMLIFKVPLSGDRQEMGEDRNGSGSGSRAVVGNVQKKCPIVYSYGIIGNIPFLQLMPFSTLTSVGDVPPPNFRSGGTRHRIPASPPPRWWQRPWLYPRCPFHLVGLPDRTLHWRRQKKQGKAQCCCVSAKFLYVAKGIKSDMPRDVF